jgi:tetratricopeptide (TPR) repeat protein
MTAVSTWFRLESRATRLACAGIVFFVALATYSLTLAPGVALVDSGELIVAARNLGVAHPPGFPLYILLAHLATLIPVGSVAVRVNFASAFFAALASATVTLAAAEALLTTRADNPKTNQRTPDRKRRAKKSADSLRSKTVPYSDPGAVAPVACLAPGLLLAFSRTLWAYATIAEVYTLNTLLIAGIFLLMFHWRRLTISDTVQPRTAKLISKHDRWMNTAAVLFGLGLGVHHVTVGLMLPALAWLVLTTEGLAFFWSKRLLRAALFAFAGLGVYIYLPLAATRSPIMNWGDPQTLQRFWWHITGNQYQVFFTFSSQRMGHHLSEFFTLIGREFGPWFLAIGLLFALGGAVALVKQDWRTFWFLALVIACDVIYAISYEIAEDKDAYYLPAFVAMVIASAFACDRLMRPMPRFGQLPLKAWHAIASVVLLLAPVVALYANLPFNNRSRYFIAQDYVENILNSVEPGGMLLTRDWQVYSPMMYANEVERRRPDVIALDIQQLRRSWYYLYLRGAYPDMIEHARDKVDAFLEDLTQWEQDHDLYQSDLSLNQRINTRFFDMIQAFVTNHLRHAPVYVTQDIALNREGEDAELTKWLADTYQPVPQGLVFQIAGKDATVQPADARLVTRGLADGTLRFEADDVVNLKVIPAYLNMLYSRGRYLAARGRHAEAITAFQQALDINMNLGVVQQALNESQSAMRKSRTGTEP